MASSNGGAVPSSGDEKAKDYEPVKTNPEAAAAADEDSDEGKVRMKKELGLLDGVAIILGIIIGSGISTALFEGYYTVIRAVCGTPDKYVGQPNINKGLLDLAEILYVAS